MAGTAADAGPPLLVPVAEPVGGPPAVAPPLLLWDAIAAAQRALGPEAPRLDVEELTKAEARLASLLSEIRARLRGALGTAFGSLSTPQACGGRCGGPAPNGHTHRQVGNSPDALDEWYTDPWASAGGKLWHRAHSNGSSGVGVGQMLGSPGDPGTGDSPRNPVEVFSLEQHDDAVTEILGLGACVARLEEVSERAGRALALDDPHWQYGRCVAAKLVELSPQGSSSFEQLLAVLLAVFEVPKDQQRTLFRRRQAAGLASVPERHAAGGGGGGVVRSREARRCLGGVAVPEGAGRGHDPDSGESLY